MNVLANSNIPSMSCLPPYPLYSALPVLHQSLARVVIPSSDGWFCSSFLLDFLLVFDVDVSWETFGVICRQPILLVVALDGCICALAAI